MTDSMRDKVTVTDNSFKEQRLETWLAHRTQTDRSLDETTNVKLSK